MYKMLQRLPPDRYDLYCQNTVKIWIIFEFSSVFSWQFSKISQKIGKRNDLICNDVVVGTAVVHCSNITHAVHLISPMHFLNTTYLRIAWG